MKLFIVIAAFVLAQAAKLDRTYLPPDAESSAGSNFLETPRQSNGFQEQTSSNSYNGFSKQNTFAQTGAYSGFDARPERVQAGFERNAAILRHDNSNDGETYAYAYETENGIYGEENGVATNGVQAQGGYSYTGDDGKVYSVRYTADENGFQPQGDHLPTPPPVPAEILKALEQNARDEAAGIFDDGSYNEVKYDSTIQRQYYNTVESNNADHFINNNAFSLNDAAESGSAEVQNAYIPPFAQRNNQESEVSQATFNKNAFVGNNAVGSANAIGGDQRAYLPPFAQRNNQRSDVTQATFNNNPLIRNDAGTQTAHLPPFAQRNNQESEVSKATFNNNAFDGNDTAGIASAIDRGQRAYLPPVAQRYNHRNDVTQATFNNNAFIRNDVAESGNPIAGTQNAYLPPFVQRNNQESEVSEATYNNNAFDDDAARSVSSIAGVQNAYLPPFPQGNSQRSIVSQPLFKNNGIQKTFALYSSSPFAYHNQQDSLATQATFNNNALPYYDVVPENSSAFPENQRAYLPPVVQQDETAGSRSSIDRVTNAYLPPLTQLHNRDIEEKSTVDKKSLDDIGYQYDTPSFGFPLSALKKIALKKNYSKN